MRLETLLAFGLLQPENILVSLSQSLRHFNGRTNLATDTRYLSKSHKRYSYQSTPAACQWATSCHRATSCHSWGHGRSGHQRGSRRLRWSRWAEGSWQSGIARCPPLRPLLQFLIWVEQILCSGLCTRKKCFSRMIHILSIPGIGGHSRKRQLFMREVFRRCPSLSMWLMLLGVAGWAAPAAAVVALFGVAFADIRL